MESFSSLLSKSRESDSLHVLWHWNGTVTKSIITERFTSLVESGFRGIVLRPMHDMNPSYMSEEFLEQFRFLLDLCEKSDVSLMIGDDFSEPAESVFAAQVHQIRNYRASNLQVAESVTLEEGESYSFTPESSTVEYVLAAPLVSRKKIALDGIVVIYDSDETAETSWVAPSGEWKVIRFSVKAVLNDEHRCMPNFFSIKCAQSYIATVLEPLCETQGKKLSSSFKGVYCEMPPLVPSNAGIPWDHELFITKYRSRYKRNLLTSLPALFFPVCDCDAKYRPHVLNFLHDTLFERFPQSIQKWAVSRDLDSWIIGAESDFTDLHSSVAPLFSLANSEFPVTGIRNDTNSPLCEAALITTASMNRHLFKRKTAMVINRNSGMKSCSLAEMKREADQAILDGVDILVADGFYINQKYHYSRTTPPSIGFNHPDFEHLKSVVTAIQETLYLASTQVESKYPFALLYPSQSAMADYSITEPDVIPLVTTVFLEVVRELNRAQIPFEVITEQDVVECDTEKDYILTNKKFGTSYGGVIIPHARLINNSLFVLLEKFAIKKGIILFLHSLPVASFDEAVGSVFANRVERLAGSRTKSVYVVRPDEIGEYLSSDERLDDQIFSPDGVHELMSVRQFVSEGIDTVLIQNRGKKTITGVLKQFGENPWMKFEVSSGKLIPLCGESESPQCSIHAEETAVFVTSSHIDVSKSTFPAENEVSRYRIKLRSDRWTFAANSMNSFPLTRWTNRMSIDRQSGILSIFYESTFENQVAGSPAYLIISDCDAKFQTHGAFRVRLNGTDLTPLESRVPSTGEKWAWFDNDSALLIYSLTDCLERGDNSVSIIRHTVGASPDPLAYPPIIAVDSPVIQTVKGWRIVPLVEEDRYQWGESGYAYLVGEGVYTTYFEIPDDAPSVSLNFESLSGSAVVTLNGKVYPPLLWPPYRIDITDSVKEKNNRLTVRVRSNLDALSSLNGKQSGMAGDLFLEISGAE